MSKKILALALAFAFAFSFTAKAVTIEELQAQIQQLQLLLAQLQGQQSVGGMYCFNTDLKYGMTSNDVKNLQIVLGVTPQTGYFGPKTLAAVKSYQASKGIPTTGYVGPMTRTALNAQYCVPPTPPTTAPEATTTTTTVVPSYGTLSVTNYPVSNPVTTYYGNGTYEVIAGQFKATGSDITVKKVPVKITYSSATNFPWNAFTTLSLWDGSTKVGEIAVTQTNAIENTFAQVYTFNISGLNWVIPNGQQKVLTLKATVVPNPPSGVTSGTWTIEFLSDIVYSDTAGVTYSSVGTISISRSGIQISTSQTPTITVSYATDNPLAGNVIASTSGTTRVDALKFNVKVEGVNVTLTSGTVKVTTSNFNDEYITALELWDGSTLIASAAPTGWASHVGTSTWTGFSLPIAAGTTKTLTVKAVIAQLPSNYSGASNKYFYISTGPTLTGIDANSNVVTANGASVTGNNLYPFLVAPTFSYVTSSYTVRGSDVDNHPQDLADTSITFSVTANGGDIYIPQYSNNSITSGVNSTVTGGRNTAVAATGAITFSGTATDVGTSTITINGNNIEVGYATGTTSSTLATNVVTAITSNSNVNTLVSATSSEGVVTLTAVTPGYAGNSITYSATTTAGTGITASPATETHLTGGLDATSVSRSWNCNSPAISEITLGAGKYLWRIPSGSTANCVLSTYITNTNTNASGYFQVILSQIKWSPVLSSSSADFITQTWGLTNIQTGAFYLGN